MSSPENLSAEEPGLLKYFIQDKHYLLHEWIDLNISVFSSVFNESLLTSSISLFITALEHLS